MTDGWFNDLTMNLSQKWAVRIKSFRIFPQKTADDNEKT